ncbi:hypothetical protein M8494_26115 [Serratia ureilytica]
MSFTDQEVADLTKRIQNAGTEVVEAKAGGGSATLSMGGRPPVSVCLWCVRCRARKALWNALTLKATANTLFFAQPLVLGKNGVEERKDIGSLSAFEQKALNEMLDVLHKDIELGEKFINN